MPDDPLAWMNAKPAGAPAPAERADPLAWMGSTKPAAPLTPAPMDEGRPRPRPAPVPGEPAILPDAPEPAAADRFYDDAWLAAQAPQSRPAPATPPSPNAGFEPVPGEDVVDRILRQQRGMQVPPVEGPAPAQGISPRAPRQGEAPGVLGSIVQGGVRGLVAGPEGIVETGRVAAGDRSARPSNEVNDPFTRRQAKPWSQVSWDEAAPWIAGKISEGLAASAPTVAAAIAGAGLGGAAAGPGGALAGGAAGGGLGAAVKTLGPAFQRAMADGKSPDDAYETALKESGVAAVFGLAGGAVGAGLRSTLKKAVFDIFAVQPALNVGQTATQNAVAGRPNTADELIESGITGLGTGLAFEAPGAARAAFTRAPSVGPEVAGAASGIQTEARAAQGADAPFNAEEPAGPQAGGIALGLPAPPRREALAGPPNLPRLTDETGTVAGEGFTARPTTPAEQGAAEARRMAREAAEAAGNSTRTQLPAPEPRAALPAPVEPPRLGVEPGVAAGEGFTTRPSDREPNQVRYQDALDLSRRVPGEEGPARRLAQAVAEVAGEPVSWVRLKPSQQVEVMRRLAKRVPAPVKAEPNKTLQNPTEPGDSAGARAKPTPEVAPPAADEPPKAPAAPEVPRSPREAPSEIESLDPARIGVDAERFQFKGGGDEHGVTERLQGVETWDPRLAGLAMVWRDAEGRDWIADGHQRLGLAKRLAANGQQGIRINAHVLRADQGVTDADARYIAAAKNVAEGTGSAIDAAKMIREARDRGIALPPLPPRSALARDGAALAKLAPEPFGMVVNEVVPPQYAAVVGRLVLDPLAQAEAMRLLAAVKPDNIRQTEMLVRDMLTSGTERGVQEGLFGAEDFASSVVLERAKIVDEALKLLARDRATFRLLVRDAERIEAEGANRLDVESNTKRLTTDEQAADALQSLATHHGPVSDALTELARRLKNGDTSRAEAAREFIGAVRRSIEGGLGEGDQSGLHRRGTEGAGEDAPAVEPPVEGQDALFSRRRDRAEDPSVPRRQPLDDRQKGLRAALGGPDVDVGRDGEPVLYTTRALLNQPVPELFTSPYAVPGGMRPRERTTTEMLREMGNTAPNPLEGGKGQVLPAMQPQEPGPDMVAVRLPNAAAGDVSKGRPENADAVRAAGHTLYRAPYYRGGYRIVVGNPDAVKIEPLDRMPRGNLNGRVYSKRRDREPTIRNDERQATLPGAEASPKQAIAARHADERGLRGKVPQKGVEDFGLFDSGLKQRDLLSGRRDADRAPDAGDVPPETADARGRLYGLIRALSRHLGVPESVGVKLVDRITQGDADALYDRTAKAVEIGLDTDADVMPFRVIHEATHVLMDPDVSPLSEGQRNTLTAGARAWLDRPFTEASLRPGSSAPAGLKTNRDYMRYVNPGAAEPVLVEEAVSHMAERHLAAGLTPRSGLERAWTRGADFLRGLGQALRGEGFTTPDAVLRGILQGKPDTRAELGRAAAPYMRTPGVVPGAALRGDEDAPKVEARAEPAAEARPFEDEVPDVAPKRADVAGRMAAEPSKAEPRPSEDEIWKGAAWRWQKVAGRMAAMEEGRGTYFSGRRDAQREQSIAGLPGFYSAVERAAERLPARGPAASMLAALRNTQGVKPEEMKWLGLDRWLAEQGTRPVTREQVAEYVRANNLGLREVVKGSSDEPLDAEAQDRAVRELNAALGAIEGAGQAAGKTTAEVDAGIWAIGRGEQHPAWIPDALADRLKAANDEMDRQEKIDGGVGGDREPPKYGDYVMPGGSQYREMLITLPEHKLSDEDAGRQFYETFVRRGGDPEWTQLLSREREQYQAKAVSKEDQSRNYKSSHWNEPNVLAHVRFNDRVDEAGRSTLMVEEVQSDWHQAGRKMGYQGEDAEAHQSRAGAVPDAPFKTTWPALVMKRMLRMAAERGYDRIAWPAGEVHAKRYSLADRVSALDYQKNDDGTYKLSYQARGRGNMVGDAIPEAKLEDYVGKEVAQRIAEGSGKETNFAGNNEKPNVYKRLSGLDLQVGGEGMRGFYDRMLPTEVNKLVKRFGASVQPSKIPTNEDGWHITPPSRTVSGKWMVKSDDYNSKGLLFDTEAEARAALAERINKEPVHSISITPELRAAALNDGFPLFSMRRDLLDTRDRLINATRDVLAKSFFPMAGGSREGRVAAAKFANALRAVNARYYEYDRLLSREFAPRQREAMWNAMDEQSVFEQVLRRDLAAMPAAKRAAYEQQARADFERDGGGVAALPPEARDVVEHMNALAKRVWGDMQDRNLVRPDAEGLPWYAPRMIVGAGEKGTAQSVGGGEAGEGGLSAMNPVGQNLSTARPKFREYLTAEMTEAAARAKFGDEARIVRDVRTLVQALMRNERSIAGADLVAYLKRTGDELGRDLVQYGSFRDDNERDWYTLDHPAMRVWRPAIDRAEDGTPKGVRKDADGKAIYEQVPIKIRADFKEPLSAVLTSPDSAVVRGLMKAKAGVMHAIMFSPAMHLMVEVGRAMPMMPGKVMTGRVFVQGNRARQDAAYMDDAIRHGLAPIARGWSVDPNTVADQSAASTIEPGKLSAAMRSVAALRDKLANAAADPFRRAGMENVGRSVRDIIAHPHQTMLWDRIYDLQVGIYDHAKDAFMRKGMDAPAAKIMAAHIANRYAGALPAETMSKAANTAANLLLFSRSFTGGNLGVMKDTVSGAPQYVLDQIRDATGDGPHGARQADKARSMLRKKAIQGFLGDLAIMFVLNAGLQSGIRVLMTDDKEAAADDEAQGYIRRLSKMLREKAEHPLSLLDPRWPLKSLHDLTPNSENEPGKEDRIYLGQDDQGRGVYMRTPLGKVGEEFQGYLFHPLKMVVNKMSTFARPVAELVMGRDTLGREIFRPGAHTTEDQVENVGRAVRHILRSQLPADFLEGVYAKVTGTDTGDRGVNTAKVLGPITGAASISSGYPGGPAEGVRAEQRRQYSFDRAEAMKAARRLAQRGEIEKAREALSMAGLPPRDAAVALRSILYPAAGEARRRRDFERRATPEHRERAETVTGGRPAYAVGGIAD